MDQWRSRKRVEPLVNPDRHNLKIRMNPVRMQVDQDSLRESILAEVPREHRQVDIAVGTWMPGGARTIQDNPVHANTRRGKPMPQLHG